MEKKKKKESKVLKLNSLSFSHICRLTAQSKVFPNNHEEGRTDRADGYQLLWVMLRERERSETVCS